MEAVRRAEKELSLLQSGVTSLRVPYIASCKNLLKTSYKLFGFVPQIGLKSEETVAEILELFVDTLRKSMNTQFSGFRSCCIFLQMHRFILQCSYGKQAKNCL